MLKRAFIWVLRQKNLSLYKTFPGVLKFLFSFNNSYSRILTKPSTQEYWPKAGQQNQKQGRLCDRTLEADRFHPFQIRASPIGPGADQEAEKDGLSIFWSLVCLSSVPGDTVELPIELPTELPVQTKKGTEYLSSKYQIQLGLPQVLFLSKKEMERWLSISDFLIQNSSHVYP